jgi:hypothetical protein
MAPLWVILPALGLILGPRVWVYRVLREHDQEDERPDGASDVARALLDQQGLQSVRVELTDGGDHYDPRARAIRLSRRNFDRKSLTAITTAAHEVAHAMQHASGYGPFTLRTQLARLAQITGEVGSVLLISVPLTFLLTRQTLPRAIVGGTALGMLGTSAAAQLAALPTELDASFRRALPMLQDGWIREDQVGDAHRILYACSLTYVGASFASVLPIWPWLGQAGPRLRADAASPMQDIVVEADSGARNKRDASARRAAPPPRSGRRRSGGRRPLEGVLRRLAKPLIRQWLVHMTDADEVVRPLRRRSQAR